LMLVHGAVPTKQILRHETIDEIIVSGRQHLT
jgi:hypothetical protein